MNLWIGVGEKGREEEHSSEERIYIVSSEKLYLREGANV